uniref:Uncharacterized protein n=1 Tax=Amphimedon queenslandica TaxID=400682 RepID=A0A1X7SWR5_AMPQE
MLACQNGHTQIVELLLKDQVDPNVQNKRGHTALMIASAKGHYKVHSNRMVLVESASYYRTPSIFEHFYSQFNDQKPVAIILSCRSDVPLQL